MTYETWQVLLILIPLLFGGIVYFIVLAESNSEANAGGVGIFSIMVSLAIFGLSTYSPQLYENSYKKMLEDRPTCLNDSTATSLGCQDKYAVWIKDSVKITDRFLSECSKMEDKINKARASK